MRLDKFLAEQGMVRSRERARDLVKSGKCKVNGLVEKKVARVIMEADRVEIADFPYVSRAGLKLAGAIEDFGIEAEGKVALDVGAATGGFSDCLLQKGAKKVYAIDIGDGQIDRELLKNERLEYRNQIDARDLSADDFDDRIDLVVIDVSFVSILALVPMLRRVVKGRAEILALIKPQFEAGRAHEGVIAEEDLLRKIRVQVEAGFDEGGFVVKKKIDAAVKGKEGNQEWMWLIERSKEAND